MPTNLSIEESARPAPGPTVVRSRPLEELIVRVIMPPKPVSVERHQVQAPQTHEPHGFD
jgi:hypothetical protein